MMGGARLYTAIGGVQSGPAMPCAFHLATDSEITRSKPGFNTTIVTQGNYDNTNYN